MTEYVLNLKTGELIKDVDFAHKLGINYFQLLMFMDSCRDEFAFYYTKSHIEAYKAHYANIDLFGKLG